MKKHRGGLFSLARRRAGAVALDFLLIVSLVTPWPVFADDQLFRETKENFAPHPFVQPDLSNGAFTYSRSIAIPPGRNGMQPDIKLTYNSSGGRQDSIVGYGWSLNIPYIEHWNKNGVDKLYNQDLAHTFFSSSLSGELLPIATTTPVNGSFLGVSESTPRHSLIALPSFLDFATGTATGTVSVLPDATPSSTVAALPDAVVSSTTAASSTPDNASSTAPVAAPGLSASSTPTTTVQDIGLQVLLPATSSAPVVVSPPATPMRPPSWLYSKELVQYDTADGDLHPGQYALQPDGVTYIAYLATTTVTDATSTYIIPAHYSGTTSTSTLTGMTLVHDIGREYVDAFSDGVNLFKKPSTQASYTNLDTRDAQFPIYSTRSTAAAFLIDPIVSLLKSIFGLKTAYAAIAYDSGQAYTSCVSGVSCTYSYTVGSVANPFLVCSNSNFNDADPGATTMTYNGQAMTEIGSNQNYLTNYSQTFYLAAPPTGAHNLVITTTNSQTNGFYAHCASYSGVDQINPIDAYQQQVNTNVNVNTDVPMTLTTLVDYDWVGMIATDIAGRTVVASASTTKRASCSDSQQDCFDGNADATPPGSKTINLKFTNSTTDHFVITGYAIKPRTLSASGLQVESQTNPLIVATSNPRFSAMYQNVATATALATSYQIQVATSSTWTSFFWDSGQKSLSSSTPAGVRSPQIYSTTTFPLDRTKYYWRMKFWDQNGSSTPWSNNSDYFIVNGNVDYGAKVESGDFLRYTRTNSDNWLANDKRGVSYTFGTASSSRINNPSATSTATIFRWYLDSMTDLNGNSVNYTFATDSGQVYPTKITYTGSGGGGGVGEIDFTYEARPDIATSSVAGYPIVTRQRLKNIYIYTNSKLTHQYQLSYTSGDNGTRSVLSSLQESGWNASAGTTTLPVVTFGYSKSTQSWTQNTNPAKWQLPGVGYGFVDSINWDIGMRVVDLNGDGLPDISLHGQSSTNGWLNTGTGWSTSSGNYLPFASLAGADLGVRMGDINGDGYLDAVRAVSCNQSTPPGSCTLGGYPINQVITGLGWGGTSRTLPVYFASSYNNNQYDDFGYALVDVNGDGLADIVGNGAGYINDGTNWVQDPAWALPAAYTASNRDNGERVVDVNGDGLADVLVGNANGNFVYLNTGHGWLLAPTWVLPAGFIDYGDTGLRILDVNGDGLPDILDSNHIYLNTGSGWSLTGGGLPTSAVYRPGSGIVYDQGVVIDDIDGDGLPDVLQSCDSTQSCNSYIRSVWLKNGVKGDLLTSITTEKGGATSVAYGRTTKLDGSGVQPNPSLQTAFDTVSTVTSNPGFGGTPATTTYGYRGGSYYYVDANNRQMAGFASSTQTNSLGYSTRTYFHQGNSSDSGNGEYNDHVAKIGKPYRVEDLDQSGNVYSRTVNQWARADYGDGRNFVKLVRALRQIYDGNSSHRDTAATTTYSDSNGNVILRDDWGEVAGNNDGTFTDIGTDGASTTYSYAASTTLATSTLSLPSRELIVDQLAGTVKDTKWFYDGLAFGSAAKGNQTEEDRLKIGSTYVSTKRTYDGFGNVLTTIDPRGSTTTLVYDTFNLYPATSTSPLGQSTTFVYDYSSGKIATTTDVNGRVFVTKYDGLNRPIEEDQPDFTTPTTLVAKTKYTYTDSTSSPSSVLRQDYLNSATTSDLYTYLDGLGRTIESKKKAETANGFIESDTVFNSIGQVGAQSLPYFTGSSSWSAATTTAYLFSNTAYDPEGRPLTIADSIGTTTNTYSDWTLTVTDPLGNRKDLIKDAWGNLAQTVEYLSATSSATTTYAWNRLGKLVKLTDAAGNVRNFSYDTLGRLLTSEDLHATAHTLFGTSSWTYDDAGNTISFLNQRNQTINYTYDRLNRPLTEDYTGNPGTEVSYSYDSGTNGIGRLVQNVRQGSATTSYTYNPIGLSASEAKLVAGTWATTSYAYMRSGLIDTITYPNSEQVSTVYNDAGDLSRVLAKSPASTTWQQVIQLTNYGANGLPSFQDYGNNTATTWTYDPTQRYRLIRKVTVSTSTTQGVPETLSL